MGALLLLNNASQKTFVLQTCAIQNKHILEEGRALVGAITDEKKVPKVTTKHNERKQFMVQAKP